MLRSILLHRSGVIAALGDDARAGVNWLICTYAIPLINPQFFEPDQRGKISSRNNHPECPLSSFSGLRRLF
jgi:hypothetical protein